MSIDTKERILSVGEELVCTKSFHSVGLSEILAAANVPKGSFYHYFPSKEAFGVELIRYYNEEGMAHWERMVKPHTGLRPLDRLIATLEMKMGMMAEQGCRQSCLLVKLSAEVSQLSEAMRTELAGIMEAWRSKWEKLIVEGQQVGDMRTDLSASSMARFIQAAWFGSMVLGHMEQGANALRCAIDSIREYLAVRK